MVVSLADRGSHVRVRHRLVNRGLWALDLAPWAITVMRGGGTVVIPNEPYAPHGDETLLPARIMALWSYSDLGDPRFSFSRGFTRVRSMPEREAAIKLGVSNTHGWAAYAVDGSVFVKRYSYEPGATYPDGGCNTETFVAGSYVELETVAPLRRLEPGATAEHVEHWYLFGGADVGDTDDEIDAALRPLVEDTTSV
jgi:hypothetical protein